MRVETWVTDNPKNFLLQFYQWFEITFARITPDTNTIVHIRIYKAVVQFTESQAKLTFILDDYQKFSFMFKFYGFIFNDKVVCYNRNMNSLGSECYIVSFWYIKRQFIGIRPLSDIDQIFCW